MNTVYDYEQQIENEKGWLFYSAALKCWRKMFDYIVGDKILDIGCGTGISLALTKVFKPLSTTIGFEGNYVAKPMWDARNLKVYTGDIYQLPFENSSFDTVYSSHVLEHCKEPSLVIKETVRVASKRIIHIVPDGNIDEKNFGSPHLHIFNRITFKKLFLSNNLEEVCYTSIQDNHINSLMTVYNVN